MVTKVAVVHQRSNGSLDGYQDSSGLPKGHWMATKVAVAHQSPEVHWVVSKVAVVHKKVIGWLLR